MEGGRRNRGGRGHRVELEVGRCSDMPLRIASGREREREGKGEKGEEREGWSERKT